MSTKRLARILITTLFSYNNPKLETAQGSSIGKGINKLYIIEYSVIKSTELLLLHAE